MNSENKQEEKVIRLSLFWLALGIVGVTILGAVGGALGDQLVNPPLPPLNETTKKLVTTVQEVTLSPSTMASKIVQDNERSILSVATTSASGEATMIATGFVITNDGLVVTPSDIREQDVVAIDHQGKQINLTLVGTDTLYGLTYWRLEEGVFVPLEIRHQDPLVATELLLMSRSHNTFSNKVNSFRINEYALPAEKSAIGLQRIAKGNTFTETTVDGSPLVDDEGKVSALLLNSNLGNALPATILRQSLDRIIKNQHQTNPVAKTGITPRYSFTSLNKEETRRFTITVAAVAPNSPAAEAGIEAGDVITEIGEQEMTWSTNFVQNISGTLPIDITILRDGEYQTFTLKAVTTS